MDEDWDEEVLALRVQENKAALFLSSLFPTGNLWRGR